MADLGMENTELPTGWHCLAVKGEIDLATVPELQTAIEAVFTSNSHPLVVDLNGSTFMDSTGLKALVMSHRRFEEHGRAFAIAVSGGPVSRLIDLSGVAGSIPIVETTDDLDAVEAS